jgi:hypothetical protein
VAEEQDIGGWVETPDDVEWDIDGVVERDAAAAAPPSGRTTKNTHTTSLGMSSGMGTGMGP